MARRWFVIGTSVLPSPAGLSVITEVGYFGGVVFQFQGDGFCSLHISLKLSFNMPAFISVGFIFGRVVCICVTDVRTFSVRAVEASEPWRRA